MAPWQLSHPAKGEPSAALCPPGKPEEAAGGDTRLSQEMERNTVLLAQFEP